MNARVQTELCDGGVYQQWTVVQSMPLFGALELPQFQIKNMGNSECLDKMFGEVEYAKRASLYECIPFWQIGNYNQVWWIAYFGNPYPPNPVNDGVNFQIQEWNYRDWCLESNPNPSANMGVSIILKCDNTKTKQTWRMERITGMPYSEGHEIVYIINDPPPFNKLTGSGPAKKTKHAQVKRK